MRAVSLNISLLLLLALSLLSCDKTPRGVLSVNDMAELIVDLQLADAYIENNSAEFETDSSKLIIKQSVFKKHGITAQEYDSSMVWYAHNMEDYNRALDKAVAILKHRYDKLSRSSDDIAEEQEMVMGGAQGAPTHDVKPKSRLGIRRQEKFNGDTIDLWKGQRSYMLTQGSRRGFITFDVLPGNDSKPGDRYQLTYLLERGANDFKVCMSIDYTDGATAQITRSTNSDGWVNIDVQSDTARQVRRIYGYVSYNIHRGHTAYVDSLSIIRSRMDKTNYGFINAQRLLERKKK